MCPQVGVYMCGGVRMCALGYIWNDYIMHECLKRVCWHVWCVLIRCVGVLVCGMYVRVSTCYLYVYYIHGVRLLCTVDNTCVCMFVCVLVYRM